MFGRLLFVVIVVIGGWFLLTQIIVPTFKGTKLFPDFRRKRTYLKQQLQQARDDEELDELQKQVDAHRKEEH